VPPLDLLPGETLAQRRSRLQAIEAERFRIETRATKQRATRRAFLKEKAAGAVRAERREFLQAKERQRFRAETRATEQRATRRAFLKTKAATEQRRLRRVRLRQEQAMLELGVSRAPPSDSRAFIHKKLLGKIKLPGILGIGTGFISGLIGRGGGGGKQDQKEQGRNLKFPLGIDTNGDCVIPFQKRDPRTGECRFFVGDRPGRDTEGFDLGEPVLGQYGAGVRPGSMIVDRAVCGRGMQLGNDGVCYNKAQISNKERMWPAGRKPLLSGGDMRAISTAARAGRRMELATKRLQKMGMMKKPVRRAGGHQHARAARNVVSV